MKQWEPVEDGDYSAMDDDVISVMDNMIAITAVDSDSVVIIDTILPPDIRLCREVDAPDIPLEAIRFLYERINGEWYMFTEGVEMDTKEAMALLAAWFGEVNKETL